MTEHMDRNEQVGWIREQVDGAMDADYSGEAQPTEIVEFFLESMNAEDVLPEWFDAHDRNLMIDLVNDQQKADLAAEHFDRLGGVRTVSRECARLDEQRKRALIGLKHGPGY